jgi:carboxypeptidase T
MNKYLIITVLLFIVSPLSAEIMQIRINDQNKDIINWLKEIGATEIRSIENDIEAYMDDEYLEYLNENNIPYSIISTESEWQRSISDYRTYSDTYTEILDIANNNPDIVDLISLGGSQGKLYFEDDYGNYGNFQHEVWCLKVSDNPESNEDEPNVYFAATIHAREPISLEVDMYILNYIVDNYGTDPDVTFWVDNTQIWFIPLMNPDGHKLVREYNSLYHRKNIRDNDGDGQADGNNNDGVDLNRNFGYVWGTNGTSSDSGSSIYNGPYAWSEPEVVYARDLLRTHKFWGGITYHSSGQWVLYPLGHLPGVCSYDHEIMHELAEDMANTIPKYSLSGSHPQLGYYTPAQAVDFGYTCQGTMGDWGYSELRLFSYTVELCWTNITTAEWIAQISEDNLEAALIFLDRVHHSTVTGNITDETRSPVVAEIYVQEIDFEAGMTSVEPVRSDSTFGRYYRVLLPGTYTFTFSLEGYDDIVVEDVVVNDSIQTELNITFGSVTFVEDVSISFTGNSVELSWQLEEGFDYEVYSSHLPYSEFQLDVDGILEGNSWQKVISEAKEFYKVRKIPSF